MSDSDALTEAREKARTNRNKYQGASKHQAKFLGTGSPSVVTQSLPKRVVYEQKTSESDGEDPFEATRKRIEKLKASEEKATPASTIKVTLPQQNKREPKKLSQVKMNPEIAATFLKAPMNVTSAPTALAPVPTTTATTVTSSTLPTEQPPSHEDLLGDLTTDVINAPVEPSVEPAAALVQDDMFDTLTAPVPEVTRPADDEWADFSSASTAQISKEISLNDLLQQGYFCLEAQRSELRCLCVQIT